ncbi:multiple sugar transport system substrate-binding protein [Enterococcus sp. PF1-24]|uniref:ABC transporter substrate-binding protein n=1 Tax=unclassified Enterococcus TaxID=2608891 RepID=UPI002473C45A|nr:MULTISPECIES: sugar ABC transporter substrate-binding protein [unclassified Enterococcus]MDH6363860.1 multiple sugar transport system substrate-binding protein [Enterococcus sp. PFB1-1]MDH6400954.1 multiple sugar transport system substrate-binding protein [Enterococcus sp. PF1-24]
MKKFLSLTLSAALIMGLSGCGSKEETKKENTNDGKVTIEFWNHWTSDGGEGKFFTEKIKEYQELNPDIEIIQTNVPIDDYTGTKLTTAFATGEGPDVFSASPGTINTFIDSGINYDLSDYFSEAVLADYSEESIADVTKNDKIIAAPFEQDLMALFYDIDMFEKAGIEPPKTWEEMIDAAKKLTTSDVSGITYDLTKGAYGNFSFMPFVWQTGGDFFEDDKSLLDTPEMIQALTLWKQMVEDGSANLKPSRFASDVGIIGDGETAMWIGGSFGIKALEDEYPDANIGVIPLPIPDGGKPASVAGGWKLVVNSQSDEKEEAAKFVQWLFLDEDAKNSVQWNTEVKFSYSPRKSVIEEAGAIYQDGLRANFTDEVYGTERPELSMEPKVADIIGDMIQNALFSMSPEEAAKDADEKLTAYFESK